MPAKPTIVRIRVSVTHGDEVIEVSGKTPLHLSGDRRRWKRQIAEHIQSQTELLSQRFEITTNPGGTS